MQNIIRGSWGVSLAGAVVVGAVGCLGGTPPSPDATAAVPERAAVQPKADASHRVPPTPTEYHVLTVNPSRGTVMINAGRDQGVRHGMTFLVLREGRIFNTIQIEQVFPDMARGVYRNPDQPPQEDDALYSEEFRAIRQAYLHRIENPTDQLRGTVVETRAELGLVYLDIGERDGVKPEMWFTVTKDGRFVGNVQVREVYDRLSFAVATEGGMEIEPGGVARSLERVARADAPARHETARPEAAVAGAGAWGAGEAEVMSHAALMAERLATAEEHAAARMPSPPDDAALLESRSDAPVKEGDPFSELAADTVPERIGAAGFGDRVSVERRPQGHVPAGRGMEAEADALTPDLFTVFDDFERRRAAQALVDAEGEAAMMPAGDDVPTRAEVWIDPEKLARLLDVPGVERDDPPGRDPVDDGVQGKGDAVGRSAPALPDGTDAVRRDMAEQARRLLGLEPPVPEGETSGRPIAPPVHLTQPGEE